MKNSTGNAVGVDYHADSLQVTIMNRDGERLVNRRIANDVGQFAQLVSRYGAVESVAVEAGTGSAAFADAVKQRTGWRVKQCHPGYVRRMKANPDKTDKSDADLVCDLNRVGYLPEVWLAPERVRDLRSLVRYRHALVGERTAIKLRVQSALRNLRLRCPKRDVWTLAGLKWLKEEALTQMPEHTSWIVDKEIERAVALCNSIKSAEARIRKATKGDVDVRRLQQEKGIGLVTAAAFKAEIGDFHRFRRGKQLARFCGFSPQNASSGARQADAGLIKAGNDNLKALLVQTAHLLRQHDPRWREMSLKLQKQGKHPCAVVAAIANRWLRGLYYRMTRDGATVL